MKRFMLALVCLVIATMAGSACAYTINDAIGDRIGNLPFELYGIDISQSGSTLTFDIFSNFDGAETVTSWTVLPADLALSLNNDNSYEYGVALTTHDAVLAGGLYRVNTGVNTTGYSSGTYNDILNGWYTSDHFAPSHQSGIGHIYNENQPVQIASIIGGALSAGSVSMFGPESSVPLYRYSVTFDASPIFADPNYSGSFNVYYGLATCANDYVSGSYAPVPEPGTMSLLGIGLLGLLGFRKKKK